MITLLPLASALIPLPIALVDLPLPGPQITCIMLSFIIMHLMLYLLFLKNDHSFIDFAHNSIV
jgi:hypothetical protein